MDLTLVHELAEQFADIENPDATITKLDNCWMVELTSDVLVIVNEDETCCYAT